MIYNRQFAFSGECEMTSRWEQGSSEHRVLVVRGGVSSPPRDEQDIPNGVHSIVHVIL